MPEPLLGLTNAEEVLLQTPDMTLFRRHREEEHFDCLYKIIHAPNAASLLANEFALMRDAALPCMPEVRGIEEVRGELALVMNVSPSLEHGLRTLRDVLHRQKKLHEQQQSRQFSRHGAPLNTAQILALMQVLAECAEALHSARIVHCAFMPEHILCSLRASEASSSLSSSDIFLLHFAHALRMSDDNTTAQTPSNQASVLPPDVRYCAPEQTGRVQRGIDFRTDLYAIGCIFYELLTGKAPFEAGLEFPDSLAILHAHIAVEPVPPNVVNEAVPQELSQMVMKLLRKNPDDRYQSAQGLKRELQECGERWQKTASLRGFVVGSLDRSSLFSLPTSLIGREQELGILTKIYHAAASGKPHLVLLGGSAGVGKSALVRELQNTIQQNTIQQNTIQQNTIQQGTMSENVPASPVKPHSKAIILSGKFDQVKRDIPYGAFVQCMEAFAHAVVSESADAVKAWKARILEAVGNNGRVLTSAFPPLERILGEQPPVPEIGVQESQNRFRLVVEQFVRVLAQKEHPLVLFWDDMQWADAGTMALLGNILKFHESAPILVMCAFRNNEIDAEHKFVKTASRLESEGIATVRTEIHALTEEQVSLLVAETLSQKPHEIKSLAHILFEKTHGNPLFLVQLLQSLHRADAIWFDAKEYAWKWSIEAAREVSLAENVVELLSERMRELPAEAQRILLLAACVGNRFDVEILSIIAEIAPERVKDILQQAENAGLVRCLSDTKQNTQTNNTQTNNTQTNNTQTVFEFVHDRVQQAAYSMIPAFERDTLHLKIARLLRATFSEVEREEMLFAMLGQYNKALSLVQSADEREYLSLLNLAAARKAKRNAVYGAAAEYIRVFGECSHDSFWQTHYEAMREASIIAAEVGYITENSALLEHYSAALMQNGRTLIDRVQGEKVKIEAYSAEGRYADAVAVGKRLLAMFGVKLPHNPTKFTAGIFLLKLRGVIGLLQHHPNAGQQQTPSEEKQEVMSILRRFTVPAIAVAQNVLPTIVYFGCEISLKHGLNPASGYFMFIAGIIMRSLFSNNLLADRCLKAGMYYAQHDGEEHPDVLRGLVSFAATTGYWYAVPSDNMRQIITWEQNLFALGVEEEATYCSLHYSAEGLQSTMPLQELASIIHEKILVVHKKRIEISIYASELWYHVMMRLQEPEPTWSEFSTLDGKFFLERDRFRICFEKNNSLILGYSYCHKLHLALLAHQYDKAIEFHREFNKHRDTGTVSSLYHWQHLYLGLAYSSLVQQGTKRYWRKFLRVLKTLERWAGWSKMFHHRYQCLQAEYLAHGGNTDEAEFWFQKAVISARTYGFLGDEALISERAGMWMHQVGNAAKAREYLREAYSLYGKWGALALQAMMRREYGEYVDDMQELPQKTASLLDSRTVAATNFQPSSQETFDMLAVMKASQAIAGEIALPSLLEKMLRVTAESSGAQRVVLLLAEERPNAARKAELFVQAELSVSGEMTVLAHSPLGTEERLPKSVIEHCAASLEPVILRDAAAEGAYINNSYIREHRIQSVLALAVKNQGKVLGVLYAENSLIAGAFTEDRVQILTMLSSQMAISIENALLVERMTTMERLKKEMEMAANVQLTMLPKDFPQIPGYDIAAFLSMAKEAGGDFYDVLPLGKNRYLLVIGDVSGKGMPAALFMSAMVNTVRTQVKYLMLEEAAEISPKRLLEIANAMARQSMTRRDFVTMTVAVLDAERHTLTFSSAGHDPAVKWNPHERALEQLRTDGIACNFGSEEVFAAKTGESRITIEPGAMIFWNTDGITEAKNEHAEEFRNNRYWATIMDALPETSPQEALEGIVEKVHTFQGAKAQYDDMTLLAIKRML
ncbi:MAG: SpoIIE family protein phosphatase [Candidatus Kapaibacteriota bacterium]